MPKYKQHFWCSTGDCPCPVKAFVERQLSYFSIEAAAEELRESKRKVLSCLKNLEDWNIVCQDKKRNLWSPDDPA